MKRLLPLVILLLTLQSLLAQASPDASPVDDSGAGFHLTGIPACIAIAVGLGTWLVAAIFVMRDAKRRNSPNKTLVTVLTWIPCFPIWLIGLIIHLVTRPKTISQV